jgi:serine protease Do
MPKMVNILLVYAIIFLTGCSGCSDSGLRHHATKHETSTGEIDYDRSKDIQYDIDEDDNTYESNYSLSGLFTKYKDAVFMVYTSKETDLYQGSGFFISSDGIAISNYHIFEGTEKGKNIEKVKKRTFSVTLKIQLFFSTLIKLQWLRSLLRGH